MSRSQLVVIVLLLAAPCAAQPADSFGELVELVEVGRDVVVFAEPGEVFVGPLTSISPGSLSVLDAGMRVVLSEARVRWVQQDWDDSILDGASFGALVGLVPIILTQVLKTGSGDFNGSGFGALVVLPITVGAGVGALVDMSQSGRGRALYRAGRGAGGVALGILW